MFTSIVSPRPSSARHREFAVVLLVAALSVIAGCAPAKPSDPPAQDQAAPRIEASAAPHAPPPVPPAKSAPPVTQVPDGPERPRFTLVLPGNRVAKIPVSVIEQYIDAHATAVHGMEGTANLKHQDESAEWHNDYEYGECFYDKGLGVTRAVTWHRHPFGSEYAELYE